MKRNRRLFLEESNRRLCNSNKNQEMRKIL